MRVNPGQAGDWINPQRKQTDRQEDILKMSDSKMTFEDFVDTVKQNIKDYLPEQYQDAEIRIGQFQKLNESYMGMQVRQDGQDTVPIVNLDKAFAAYDNGMRMPGLSGMDALLGQIAEQIQSEPGLETAWLKDYSQVKDSLFIRVNDAKENAESLRDLPHTEVDGLAVSYHIAFKGRQGMEASVPVTYSLMKTYGIDQEQLHTDALASAAALNPPVFVSMAEMMGRMTGMDAEELAPMTPGPDLMVLTNEQAFYGAGALFYPQMMDSIADYTGSNYYILPSSIHETLILADDGTMDRETLENMVQEINEMVVAPEERLSDHVYHYDAKDHVLEKAETYDFRMEQKEAAAEKAAMEAAAKAAYADAAKAEAGMGKDHEEKDEKEIREAPSHNDGKDVSGQGHPERKPDRENSRNGQRVEKRQPSQDREKRETAPKKERKSVLARLNEKKEKLKSQPDKGAPHRSKSNEIS